MDVLLDWQHYHRLNINLLSVIGLWPYGNKFVLQLKRFLGSFFVLLCCLSQPATFLTVQYTKKMLLRNIPCIFVGCAITVKFTSFLIAGDCIKRITESIDGDWKGLSSEEEIQIIKKYVERGKFHTKGFAMFIFPLGLCLVILTLSPVLLDLLIPLNQARSRTFPIMFEFFFDQQKHFFLAAFFFDGAIIVAGFVLVSTEALLIVYIQHARALFEVTSRRIKNLLCASATNDSKRSNNVVAIGQVVSIHERLILDSWHMTFNEIYTYPHRQCKSLREDLLPSYIILLAFGIMGLGAHIFRCTQTFASDEYMECLTSAMFCVGILGYMFYLNYMFQSLLDWSVNIFDVLYNSKWYEFPSTTRKLILFCMINCTKPVGIDVCSIFPPSYEGFFLIVRLTTSYATALYSFQ